MLTRQEFEKQKELFLLYLTEQKLKAYNTRRAYNADMVQLIEFWQALEEADQKVFLFDEVLERFSAALLNFSV